MDMLAKSTKNLKLYTRACLTGLLLTATSLSVSADTIVGSAHDFSTSGWTGKEICVACHTPVKNNDYVFTKPAPMYNLPQK